VEKEKEMRRRKKKSRLSSGLGSEMIAGQKVRLRVKKLADARNDYEWQTDRELGKLDAMRPLTMSYARYLLDYADELQSPNRRRHILAVETVEGEHIGNCVYYNVDKEANEAEIGIMIGNRDYWDKGYGTDSIVTLVNHLFRKTNLRRIHLKTLEGNLRAQKCFQKSGFTPCGQMARNGYDFVLMDISHKQWEERQAKLSGQKPR
jgi:RimJ/RimL family protein N-acetyltransferase